MGVDCYYHVSPCSIIFTVLYRSTIKYNHLWLCTVETEEKSIVHLCV